MDDIVMGVSYRPPDQEEVDKAFFRQLEEPKYKNGVYVYLKPERFYIRKPKTVVRHHGTLSPTWEEAWASAYWRPQPRQSSGGGCRHPSLGQQAVPGCCSTAGAGDSGRVLVVGYVHWVRSCWQAKELRRRQAAARCQGE